VQGVGGGRRRPERSDGGEMGVNTEQILRWDHHEKLEVARGKEKRWANVRGEGGIKILAK